MSVTSDDNNLNDGVIVVSIGTRYASYCANISRTFLIDPTKKQVCELMTRTGEGWGSTTDMKPPLYLHFIIIIR